MSFDRKSLIDGAAAFGVGLDDEQVERFERFASILEEWNTRFNLTRIPISEVVPGHFLDSLSVCQAIEPDRGATRLLDLGTGAGFPGIPLKIARPALALTLLDSTRKKLDFLRAAVAHLGLAEVDLCHARAEDVGREARWRETFDLVTARALARLNVLAEWALPLVRSGGRFVAMKGAEVDEELREAAAAIRELGGELLDVVQLRIPGTEVYRSLVIVGKCASTDPRYPRSTKQIRKNPLGSDGPLIE